MYKVVFPEANNPYIQEAAQLLKNDCEAVLLNHDLPQAIRLLSNHQVDAMVAGIDCPSREIILAAKEHIGLRPDFQTFSSLFLCDFPDGRRYLVADGATCRQPSAKQLSEIILLLNEAAERLLDQTPRLALLSFSTFGSGVGKTPDPSITKIHEAISLALERQPHLIIDGEMQLDAAVNPRVAAKKASAKNSPVAGQANVLITPDINSGNILYKSIEQFAGATVAGPVLLGFNSPISDLSRGSTPEDIVLTTRSVLKLI